MKDKRPDVRTVILQPYIIDILRALKQPKRFGDLTKSVPNERTLSLKLAKLQDYDFVKLVHTKIEGKYVNTYELTERGKKLIKVLEEIK